MIERDELEKIKSQMWSFASKLNDLQSRVAVLEAQNARLREENRALAQPVDFARPENELSAQTVQIAQENAAFAQPENRETAPENPFVLSAPVTPPPESIAPSQPQQQPEELAYAQPVGYEKAPAYAVDNPVSRAIDWLARGNVLLKVGVLVLFLGLAFLLRYIGGTVPLSVRYLVVFVAGVAAAVSGEILQNKRRDYGLTLQGFGFGVMYLTALAAVKLHNILPANIAFVVMLSAVVLMAWRAVIQDAKIMAQVAVIGGLAAPVLTADGAGSHIALFSFLAILNMGVAVIAWFRAWRSLNLIGAIGTLWIALLWSREYHAGLFASCEFFLIYHWLLYTLVACFFAHRTLQKEPLRGELCKIPNNATLRRILESICAYGMHISALDSTLLFGTALSTFCLQYAMVKPWENAAAYSALLWAAVYGGFAVHYSRKDENFAVLKQAFAVLSALFVTIAIPLALEQQWTASAWALEAALVYVFGMRQRQPHTRILALAVFALAALAQFNTVHIAPSSHPTLLQGSGIGACIVMAGGAAIYCVWEMLHRKNSAQWEFNAVSIIAVLTLANVLSLPLLTLASKHCIPVLSAMGVGFAALQWQKPQVVFSIFSLLAVLLALFCIPDAEKQSAVIVCSALLWMSAAYLLHHARWRNAERKGEMDSNTALGAVSLWLGIAFAIQYLADIFRADGAFAPVSAMGCAGFEWMLHVECVRFAPVSAMVCAGLLVWAGLLLFAVWRKWQEALYSAVLLAFGGALYFWLFAIQKWQAGNTLFLGGLILFLASILAVFTLYWLPEDKKNPYQNNAAHVAVALAHIFLWSSFLHAAHAHFAALRPLETLLVPLAAWCVFTYRSGWFGQYAALYQQSVSSVLAVFCALWVLRVNFAAPTAHSYFPLFNTIEIGSIAAIAQFWQWQKQGLPEELRSEEGRRLIQVGMALVALIVLSAGVMRCWHYYSGIDWNARALLSSFGVQATLSIIWSIAAIGCMFIANRMQRRPLWIAGAALMGVVVCKLFLVELANRGGIERIVSFIIVGLLLLFVGWFAPVPPKEEA